MSIDISIEIDSEALEATLQTMQNVLDPDAVVDEAATIILNNTRQRYLQEKAPDGSKWPPSKAATLRRRGGGTGTLFDTGTLWRSIQLAATAHIGERHITEGAYTKQGVEYGKFHQFGTEHLPKREFMGIADDDIELFEQRIMQRVAEALGV